MQESQQSDPAFSEGSTNPPIAPPSASSVSSGRSPLRSWSETWAAAIAFYTSIPIPAGWALNFQTVARWAPLVGVMVGGLLALLYSGLAWLGMPIWTRSGLTILAWVGITGGLHLDGAMDTADGLAVLDPQRRLTVMADSHTGAFGVMAAIALVLLKTLALVEQPSAWGLPLVLAAGWGRWAQQVAIARYPYLKPTGKGAFHKVALSSWRDTVPALGLLLPLSVLLPLGMGGGWFQAGVYSLGGLAIALIVAHGFYLKLGGHTGDTYGATVEWTEALFLVSCTLL